MEKILYENFCLGFMYIDEILRKHFRHCVVIVASHWRKEAYHIFIDKNRFHGIRNKKVRNLYQFVSKIEMLLLLVVHICTTLTYVMTSLGA